MKPNNDEFCILPWVHASISNSGKVSPCCRIIQYNPEPFGSLHKNTLSEIRGNPRFSEFREMMLNRQTPLNCKECHLQEMANLPTLRTLFNKKYESIAQHIKTKKINEPLPMRYGEIRFSNVCNLACRTCGIESSSRWHKDHLELHGASNKIFYSHANKEQGLINDFINNIDEVDTIYFAGGEPLLHSGHYQLLQTLIDLNRTDITLVYNSNLTTLKLGPSHVFHLWDKFKTVTIYASIDATHERFNLIRHGEEWNVVENNIKKVKLFMPRINVVFSITISILNLFHLPDLINYSLNKGLIPNLDFIQYNFVFEPLYYQVNLLPQGLRAAVLDKLRKIAHSQNEVPNKDLLAAIQFIENAFKTNPTQETIDQFKAMTGKLDFLRQENTLGVLPELGELLR